MTVASPPESRAQRARRVLILGGLTAFGPLSLDMYLPALPALARGFSAAESEVQLTLTACVLGIAIGQVLAGPLSDTLGRRRPLMAGLALYTAASLLCAAAPAVPALTAFRLLQGFGAAAGIVIARAVVRDLHSGTAAARYFSMLMLVAGSAPILAPVIGGQVLRVTSWRGVFVVLGLFGAALLVASALGLRETLPADRRRSGELRDTLRTFGGLLTDRVFLGYALASGFAFAALFSYISGSPFVLQQLFGLSPQQFSAVFAMNAVGIVVSGQVNGRLGRARADAHRGAGGHRGRRGDAPGRHGRRARPGGHPAPAVRRGGQHRVRDAQLHGPGALRLSPLGRLRLRAARPVAVHRRRGGRPAGRPRRRQRATDGDRDGRLQPPRRAGLPRSGSPLRRARRHEQRERRRRRGFRTREGRRRRVRTV
jgi:Bcr/CflA subfamily drug resistance transporter